jgi:hypothetical protein
MHGTDDSCIGTHHIHICPRSRIAAVLQRVLTVGVVLAVVWAFIQLLQGTWRLHELLPIKILRPIQWYEGARSGLPLLNRHTAVELVGRCIGRFTALTVRETHNMMIWTFCLKPTW